MSFNTILAKYRKISFNERDKGDRFERLMQAYLLTDPTYANKLKKVWLWSEYHVRMIWEVVIQVLIFSIAVFITKAFTYFTMLL